MPPMGTTTGRSGPTCRITMPTTGTSWGPGERLLICIGINPSTAAPGDLDNTLKSVGIAAGRVYDSFLMFNVYAQRATPAGGHGPGVQAAPSTGRTWRPSAASWNRWGRVCPAVWAAWGTIIEAPYLRDCVRDMVAIGGGVQGPSGCAPASAPRKAIPPPPSTCGKRRKCGPLQKWCPTWTACESRTSRKETEHLAWRTPDGGIYSEAGYEQVFTAR